MPLLPSVPVLGPPRSILLENHRIPLRTRAALSFFADAPLVIHRLPTTFAHPFFSNRTPRRLLAACLESVLRKEGVRPSVVVPVRSFATSPCGYPRCLFPYSALREASLWEVFEFFFERAPSAYPSSIPPWSPFRPTPPGSLLVSLRPGTSRWLALCPLAYKSPWTSSRDVSSPPASLCGRLSSSLRLWPSFEAVFSFEHTQFRIQTMPSVRLVVVSSSE